MSLIDSIMSHFPRARLIVVADPTRLSGDGPDDMRVRLPVSGWESQGKHARQLHQQANRDGAPLILYVGTQARTHAQGSIDGLPLAYLRAADVALVLEGEVAKVIKDRYSPEHDSVARARGRFTNLCVVKEPSC